MPSTAHMTIASSLLKPPTSEVSVCGRTEFKHPNVPLPPTSEIFADVGNFPEPFGVENLSEPSKIRASQEARLRTVRKNCRRRQPPGWLADLNETQTVWLFPHRAGNAYEAHDVLGSALTRIMPSCIIWHGTQTVWVSRTVRNFEDRLHRNSRS